MAEKESDIFNNINSLIDQKKFEEAEQILESILSTNTLEPQNISYAQFLIGYINSRTYFKNKKIDKAKINLLDCINSNYPHNYAYVAYADLEEDKNIAVNYLLSGLMKFPKSPYIYQSLLKHTTSFDEKIKYIENIKKENIVDIDLTNDIISFLIETNNWIEISIFIEKIITKPELSSESAIFLKLLLGYSLTFKEKKEDLDTAFKIFAELIKQDISNMLEYSHYMGMILIAIKQNNIENVIYYFDKLPISNKLSDIWGFPWSPIEINFEKIYSDVFSKLALLFKKDKPRKEKVLVLKSLYLYSPDKMGIGLIRYSKKDIQILKDFFKKNVNNICIAEALFTMQINLKLKFQAYQTYIELINSNISDLDKIEMDGEDIFLNISDEETEQIYLDLINKIKTLWRFPKKFINEIFDGIVELLFQKSSTDKYAKISNLADGIIKNNDFLNQSYVLFEMAYSYSETAKSKEAIQLYEKELEPDKNNISVLNNLGILYEKIGNYYKAYQLLKKANDLSPTDDTCSINLKRVEKLIWTLKTQEIQAYSKNLNLTYLENIGYDNILKNYLDKIRDLNLKEILKRDLKECALCIACGQNKAATLLCGSIIEAMLMDSILNKSIVKYKIIVGSRNKQIAVKSMNLSQLLFVADKENLISKKTYHLAHFIREYRNIIHPAKELREKSELDISNDNTILIWNILKQIMKDLFA